MRKILFLLYIYFSSVSFICDRNSKIQAIEIKSHAELLLPNQDELAIFEPHIKLVTIGEYRLYVSPVISGKKYLHLNNDGEVEKEDLLSRDTTFKVFVVKKNDTIGLSYAKESFEKEKGIAVRIDTFLKSYNIDENSFQALDVDLGKPTEVKVMGKKMREIFKIKKDNYTQPDSIYREYDKDLIDVDFSYSPRLDKLNNSKLYKTTWVVNEIPKDSLIPNVTVPKRQFWFAIKKIEISDSDKKLYLALIEKFEKDLKERKLN